MELPQSMGKLMHPVGELDLKSLFHDKSWFIPMWSLPSPVPLLFPKQRKVGITLVKFMGTVLGGYAGQISKWTQHCRRQASDMCQADPLSWATLLRSLAVFGGSQVDRCWDAMQDKDVKPELLTPSGSWWWSSDFWVFGGSCCVILSYGKQRPCGVQNLEREMLSQGPCS